MTVPGIKFLADENLPRQIVEQLRALTLDVVWAAEMTPGIDDADWLTIGRREKRILLTDDKDFGEVVFAKGLSGGGIVLLRLYRLSLPMKVANLEPRWPKILSHAEGNFVVVTEDRIRIRRLPASEG